MPKPLPKELLSKAGTAPLPGTAKLPNAGAALPEVPCVDTKDECKEWAAKGECTKAAPKMDKLCPASCGACPVKPDEVFGDLDHDSDGNVTVKELAKRLAAVDEARQRLDQESGRLAKNDAHAAEQAAKPAEHFLTAFANLDKDQSGELTPDELTDEMRKRQESMEKNLKRNLSPGQSKADVEAEIQRMKEYEKGRFRLSDADKTGGLNLTEYVYGRLKHWPELEAKMRDPVGLAAKTMTKHDKDGDGMIQMPEAVEGHSALHGLTHPRMLRRLLKEEL
jgi:Ca2+-binding EF-hand superfamily protein